MLTLSTEQCSTDSWSQVSSQVLSDTVYQSSKWAYENI